MMNDDSNKDGKRRAIPANIVALLLVVVFVLAAISFWLINRLVLKYEPMKDLQINSKVIEKNETLAKITAEMVRKEINKILLVGSFYSSKKDIIALIEKEKWRDAINLMSGILKEFSKDEVERIILFDITGTLQADIPEIKEASGQNFAFRDWYRGVTQSFKPYVSEVYTRTATPKFNVVGLTLPIFNNKNTPIAILLIQIKTDTFIRWLKEARFGNSGLSFIVDQRGHVVAHPDLPSQGEIVDYSSRSDVQRVISGQSGTDIIVNSKKEKLISSFEPIPEFHWGIITRIQIEELENSGLIKDNTDSGGGVYKALLKH